MSKNEKFLKNWLNCWILHIFYLQLLNFHREYWKKKPRKCGALALHNISRCRVESQPIHNVCFIFPKFHIYHCLAKCRMTYRIRMFSPKETNTSTIYHFFQLTDDTYGIYRPRTRLKIKWIIRFFKDYFGQRLWRRSLISWNHGGQCLVTRQFELNSY